MKAQANDGSVKFGAANSAARQETANSPLNNQLEEDGGNLKHLEGYFDNLAAAAVNKKGVLQQLVSNNTTLSTSNESLAAFVKNPSNGIKNLEREISLLEKGRSGQRKEYHPLRSLQKIRIPPASRLF